MGERRAIPLWPLPALAALLPAAGALLALALYRNADGSFCNPFLADCGSISRIKNWVPRSTSARPS